MSTQKNTNESVDNFEDLASYMLKNGQPLVHIPEDQVSVIFEDSNINDTFGNSEESSFEASETSYIDFEKELISDIKNAEEVLNESNGIAGDVVPDPSIENVSDANVDNTGVVSHLDAEGVLSLINRMNDSLDEINEDIENIKKSGMEESKIESDLLMLRERLSDEEINHIRKIFPELYPLINEGDIEIIDNIQTKLNSVKKGKGLKDKLRTLKNNKEITQAEEKAFFEALERRDTFIEEAKKNNLSPKIAGSVYRIGKSLMEDINSTSSEDNKDIQAETKDEVQENLNDENQFSPAENINNKYKIVKDGLLNDCATYRKDVEDIKVEDEKTRILNAISEFEKNVVDSFNQNTEIDVYTVDSLIDYSTGIRENIKKALLQKPLARHDVTSEKIENENQESVVENKISNEVYSRELESIQECRKIAHEINNVDIKNEIFAILRESESEIRSIVMRDIPDSDKSALINRVANKNYDKFNIIIKKYKTDYSDDEKVADISEELEVDDNDNEEKKGNKEIHNNILLNFESLGIDASVLKNVSGFSNLSGAKQYLVFKNYQSVIWDKVRIESKQESDAKWHKNTVVGKLGRFGLSLITLGTARTYREKLKQKEIADSLIRGDALPYENRRSILESLVEVANETPEVTLDSSNNIQIEYIEKNKFKKNPYSSEIINEFNRAASEYASLPYSWFDDNNPFESESEKEVSFTTKLLGQKNGFITGKERARLAELRENYNYAKEEYLKLYIEEYGNSPEVRRDALKELNSLDEKIRMNQLFNSDPRSESLLQDIDDTSVFNQAMSDFVAKKGQFMAYGSLTRISASLAISGIATPVALAVFAGVSYLRGKREVRDMLKMKREAGILSDDVLREDVVYIVDLEKSLSDLKKARVEAQMAGRDVEVYHLDARINEVNDKIRNGHKIERKTRKLGEFRDAKFFSDRIDSLVEKYELLNNSKGQEAEARIIERKIAQTSALMRELLNNNLLSFGYSSESDDKSKDAKKLLNKLSFIQALSKADASVAIDDESIQRKIADIVKIRRDKIDELDNKKSLNHIKHSVKNSIIFGGAGYALTHLIADFFGGNSHVENHSYINKSKSAVEDIVRVEKAKSGEGLPLKEMVRLKGNDVPTQESIDKEGIIHSNDTPIDNSPITIEDIKKDILDKTYDTPEESKFEINGVTKPRPALESDVNIQQFESVHEIETKWSELSVQDKLGATETLIPKYIKDMLGSNFKAFESYAKSMPSSSLLIDNPSFSHSKIDMLKDLRGELFKRQISPDWGFDYSEKMTLYDYVRLTFRAKMMTEGPLSVK